jgi:hypothetical protein
MKGLGNTLIIAGVLLVLYSILGRFVGKGAGIGLGIVNIKAASGIVMATFCVALGIAAKLWNQ